ncbi:MAG TPA: hypothetical protein VJZ24_02960 [Thermodesulfovibrionales bacterium]|nr:hypothetical protein [Thermodesulfovibrionales bacterium]
MRKQIERHKEKIDEEEHKSFSNEGLIAHWEKEIIAFEKQIEKALKKLEE